MAFVYLITDQTNGKQYVGKTITSIQTRWRQHLSTANETCKQIKYLLHSAIKKRGKENFSVECLAEFPSNEDALLAEQLFIAALKTRAPFGYNMTDGGEGTTGHRLSKKQKQEMSLRHTEMFKCSPDLRQRISESVSLTMTPEHRSLLSTKSKEAWANPDTREKFIKGLTGRKCVHKNPKEHCRRGHEFTKENTYWNGGRRYCCTCLKDYYLSHGGKGRQRGRETGQFKTRTHCLKGHELTEDNIRLIPQKERTIRRCLICYKEKQKVINQRNRDKRREAKKCRAD